MIHKLAYTEGLNQQDPRYMGVGGAVVKYVPWKEWDTIEALT